MIPMGAIMKADNWINGIYKQDYIIMIVEDEITLLDLYMDELHDCGYNVVGSTSGTNFLTLFKKVDPDIIVFDIRLGDSDGLKLLEIVKSTNRNIPVILYSAFAMYKKDFSSWMADDYVVKSSNINEIIQAIEKQLTTFRDKSREPRILHNQTFKIDNISNNMNISKEGANKLVTKYKATSPTLRISSNLELFIRSITHSIKNEFLLIGTYISMIKDHDRTNQEIVDLIEKARGSMAYCQVLIRRMLDYMNMGVPPLGDIRISEIIEKIILIAYYRIPPAIEFKITADEVAKQTVILSNADQIVGVIIELVNNSIRALKYQGKLEIIITTTESSVLIDIKDNGPGFPGQFKRGLFRKQLPSSYGHGTGLLLSYKVLKAQNATLRLGTMNTKGTLFIIDLPKSSLAKEP
jgi:two-component system, OmpR family, response regulator